MYAMKHLKINRTQSRYIILILVCKQSQQSGANTRKAALSLLRRAVLNGKLTLLLVDRIKIGAKIVSMFN
jgi:hypothetical protein